MQLATKTARSTTKGLWAGRIISGVAVVFLLLDSAMKVMKLTAAVKGTIQLGYPGSVVASLGIVLLVCTVAYAIPRTSVFGAILLTGYLGGAVASQVRVGHPLFGYVLFPVYVGVLIWGGLFLRNHRLRALISQRA